MQPTRMIFEDTPAFIPVPPAYQHHAIEVTLWPLDDLDKASASWQPSSPSELFANPQSDSIPRWGEFFQRFTHESDQEVRCSRDEIYAEHLR